MSLKNHCVCELYCDGHFLGKTIELDYKMSRPRSPMGTPSSVIDCDVNFRMIGVEKNMKKYFDIEDRDVNVFSIKFFCNGELLHEYDGLFFVSANYFDTSRGCGCSDDILWLNNLRLTNR